MLLVSPLDPPLTVMCIQDPGDLCEGLMHWNAVETFIAGDYVQLAK